MSARIYLPLLLTLTLVLNACRSAQKFVESGDYDGAIEFCVEKLQGKRKKKEEYVVGLEKAFAKAQQRDLARIQQLQNENRPQNWERINGIYKDIAYRQNRVLPLTPLTASNGYTARFDFMDIAQLEFDSRNKAAEFLYQHAEAQLALAERGDKRAARIAYNDLCDIERKYFKSYKNKDQLKADARDLGTSYVLFEVENHSNRVLPVNFESVITNIGKYELDSDWKSFYFEAQPGIQFDYKVVFDVNDIDVSPEQVRERAYTDEKEIKDGWEYVLDKKGNVLKDSTGNDVKVPRYVRIRANVLEVFQRKAVRLAGQVKIYDAYRNTLLDNRSLATEVHFENYASTFTGDRRALSDESCRRIGNNPVPFPADWDMMVQAAERLKPDLREELRRNQSIF